MTEIWLAFLTGAAGSLHCVGMCGGIVTAVAFSGREGKRSARIAVQLFYNAGRVVTYTLLGLLAGGIGASLDLFLLKRAAAWVFAGANLFVALVGVGTVVGARSVNLASLEMGGAAILSRPLRRMLAGGSAMRGFPLGLVLGFLPCGLVYAPLVVAAGTADPWRGAAVMAALGLGTVPLLLTFGSVAASLSAVLRGRVLRLTGFLLLLLGAAGFWRVLGKIGVLPPFPLW